MNLRSIVSLVAFAGVLCFTASIVQAADAPAEAAKGTPYAQLSKTTSQQPNSTDPTIVEMDSNDALNEITHGDKAKTGDVIIKETGVYFIVAAAQVGKETSESDEYVDLWLKQNGKDIDNSNCRQAIKDPKFTTVLVSQGISELKAGDVLNVAFAVSSTGKGLGILATKPKGEPVIPSIIFSIYKIK